MRATSSAGGRRLVAATQRYSGALTETHIAIARLLAVGMEDTAVAAKVHVSERTLRRYVRDLMDVLKAPSRCALGARVATRGWLEATRVERPHVAPGTAAYGASKLPK